MKNSTKMLLGFAVVAVVIVGVVAVNSPPIASPDAQGSIGAVQKYRDEQIKPADVVLGDEQGRRVEAALYGSLFEQAAQLQSFSAEIASFSRNLDNREQLEAFSGTLGSREEALAKSALLAASDLQSKEQLAAFQSDLQSMARGFDNRTNLGMKDLQSFEASLASMQQDLQAKVDLQSRELMAAQSRLDSFKQLGGRDATLESMKADLGSLADALAARDQLASKVIESRILESRVEQLGARVLEQKSLLGLRQELGAIEKNLGSRDNLGDRAAALDSRSAEFLGLSTKLEARALDNMSARLESRNLEAKSLIGIRQMVESADSSLESRNLGSMKNDLQSFEKELGSREAELNQKFALGMQAELAAISDHLASRENLASKFDLASKSDLAAKSGLGAKSLDSKTLDAKSDLANRDSLESFDAYLGSLSKSLESRSDLASRESALGSRAQELQNRASDLQAKYAD